MKLLIAVALTLGVFSDNAEALECIDVPLSTAVAGSDVVLFGRVESTQNVIPAETLQPNPQVGYFYTAMIRVLEVWKGSSPPTIELLQEPVVGGMNLTQHVGTTYLFMLRRLSPAAPFRPPAVGAFGYTAYECISKPMGGSEEITRELGKSHPPAAK